MLEALAEEEKIRLSRVEQVDVVFDGRLTDASGRPIDATIPVARTEFEALIRADVERSINLTQDVLTRHGLAADAIGRAVLVGGPTLTPFLREMLATRLGIPLDTRIDPMTVVARGAALFASE